MRSRALLAAGPAPLRLVLWGALALGLAAMPAAAQPQQFPGTGNRAVADLGADMVRLEARIDELVGQIQQLQFRNRQLEDQLDRALNDIEFRLGELEGGGMPPAAAPAGAAAAAPPAGFDVMAPPQIPFPPSAQPQPVVQQPVVGLLPVAPPQSSVLPQGDPTTQYNNAYALLEARDYGGAELAFQRFLQGNASHPLASNAQYWLGETYYVRGRFNEAAVAFAQNYQLYPTGLKAAESLLKLGMALAALGQRPDACQIFAQLRVEFPAASTTVLRRADQERDRLQCF